MDCTVCDGDGCFIYPNGEDGTIDIRCHACNGTGADANEEPDTSYGIEMQERSWDSYVYGN